MAVEKESSRLAKDKPVEGAIPTVFGCGFPRRETRTPFHSPLVSVAEQHALLFGGKLGGARDPRAGGGFILIYPASRDAIERRFTGGGIAHLAGETERALRLAVKRPDNAAHHRIPILTSRPLAGDGIDAFRHGGRLHGNE